MVTSRRTFYIGLFAACIVSRLATTIYYVEDTDSLRFALSVYDRFDLAQLQPHFPGYPVFWAAAKTLYLTTGSFAIAFSLVGGLATFAVIYAAIKLSHRDPTSIEGLAVAFIVFFNPMIWLMGNRYMPDLAGLALALGALLLLLTSSRFLVPSSRFLTADSRSLMTSPRILTASSRSMWGGVATGLLAGTRLSYAPLLLPSYAAALRRQPLRLLAATAAGVLVWLAPMLLDAGWSDLISAASRQTEGHFTEFGGAVATDPDLLTRTVRLVESIWADGLGAWWPGRHALTLLVSAFIAATLAAALRHPPAKTSDIAQSKHPVPYPPSPAQPAKDARTASPVPGPLSPAQAAEDIRTSSPVPGPPIPARAAKNALSSPLTLLLAAAALYTLWIFLFQNVIYKSRHVLPLVALIAVPMGIGLAHLIRSQRPIIRAAAVAGALAYAAVTLVLVTQHQRPTAIAQAKSLVEAVEPDVVASIPLVNYYFSAQGVDAEYLSVQSNEDRERLATARGTVLVVGRFPDVMPPNPARADTFYHNPHVNRMWPEVEVYVYER